MLFSVTNVLIALIAASLASQLARTLAQAGFIEAWTTPLWDSSWLLSPDSALGTFLHALMGYDAQPSAAQLAAYLGTLAFIVIGTRLLRPKAGGPQATRQAGLSTPANDTNGAGSIRPEGPTSSWPGSRPIWRRMPAGRSCV